MNAGRKPLGLLDAVALIVGIVIGAGIFETPPTVFAAVVTPGQTILLWLAGAVVAACGALCYAELAAAYPTDAGEAEYFTHAFGRCSGWYFTWIQLVCFRTAAAIVSIAYVFSRHAVEIVPLPGWILTSGLIVVLTGVNALGLRPGKWTQNTLAAIKVAGFAAIILAGLATSPAGGHAPAEYEPHGFALALVLIMYAYSGWHEAAYIVGDLREPQRNLPRAMLIGVAVVTVVYLAVDRAALHSLGLTGLRELEAREAPFGLALFSAARLPVTAFALFVVLVTLGSTNGTILSGSRLFATVGTTQPGYGWLARGRTRADAPLAALGVQAAISLAFVAAIELTGGGSGFRRIVTATTPVLWVIFFGAGLALVVLRFREPRRDRPFRVPAYPLVAGVYLTACGFMLYESTRYAVTKWGAECWLMVGLLAAGLPYWWWVHRDAAAHIAKP